MTLPVPLSTFRANLPHYIALLQEGTQIMVTKHGRDVALVTKPEDAAGVEDPPGEELMERLLSGEGEPGWSIPPTATFTDADGNPVNESDIAPTDTIRVAFSVGAAPSTTPNAPVARPPRKRTPKPPPPPKDPKPPGPADLARLIGWPKSAFPVNFQKPRPGKGDDWTLWGKLGHKRVWPGLGKLGRAEALGWCIKAVEGGE
jgi:prevent-host-death family protein